MTNTSLAPEVEAPPLEPHHYPAVRSKKDQILRAGIRGAIAAMAMSGLRQAWTGLGLVKKVPPEAVLERTAPRLVRTIPAERRQAIIEFVHWAYGAAGGAAFGILPRSVRAQPWVGPTYGALHWWLFEAGITPLLGLQPHRDNDPVERMALFADHLLYGLIVAATPWPIRD